VILSLVKTSTDAHGDLLLEREAQWLRELEAVEPLEGQVPRLLEEGRAAGGHRYLVVSIPGETGATRGETRAFTPDHARFLAALGKARFRATDFEVSGCGEALQRSLRRLEGRAPPQTVAVLQEAFHECETSLLYWTGPYVLAQGDFAPWNIRTLGSQLFVYDWGQARADASPLDDVLHYVMIQRALRSQPVDATFLQSAMKSAHEFAVKAYPEWSWRPRVIGALTLVYLLGVILYHSDAKGGLDPADRVVNSYWQLLEKRSRWLPE
jgi:hypothetical protein